MVEIRHAYGANDIASVREMFREYETWLEMDLCFQGFEDELKGLPGKYAPPRGRLLLATLTEGTAGCVAMRDLGSNICEMKRLYVRPSARGLGLGNALIEKIIAEARIRGYEKMRLDTFPPKMGKAVSLYEAHGFRPIEPYYDNPYPETLFMECAIG